MMPEKKVSNFFSWSAMFGAFFLISGIGMAIATFYDPDTIKMVTKHLPFHIFILIFSWALCAVGIWMALDDWQLGETTGRCYYCKEKIWNFQARVIVTWPEFTEYSKVEKNISKGMHCKCHKEAAEKFRIPDPRFSSLEI
jgi:hypothetical protein